MEKFFITDQGKVRQQNEDAGGFITNESEQLLSVIADGMGGHKAGDVASEIVRSFFFTEWAKIEKFDSPEEVEDWLDEKLREVNLKVYQYAQENQECQGMGTTVIVAVFLNNDIIIAHIGDSRCYLYTEELKQVTEDHSLVNELYRKGEISKSQADFHPRKNILTKALGTDVSIGPEIFTINWDPGERFLICTDGLSDKVSDNEIEIFLSKQEPLNKIGEDLVARANDLGGEDNITLALLENSNQKDGDPAC